MTAGTPAQPTRPRMNCQYVRLFSGLRRSTSRGGTVATGLVASLARPGGNITGLTSISSEMEGTRGHPVNLIERHVEYLVLLADDQMPDRTAATEGRLWRGHSRPAQPHGNFDLDRG